MRIPLILQILLLFLAGGSATALEPPGEVAQGKSEAVLDGGDNQFETAPGDEVRFEPSRPSPVRESSGDEARLAMPARARKPRDDPSGPTYQLSPFVGARSIVVLGHIYHAVNWKRGGDSRRTAFLGSFSKQPSYVGGASVEVIPATGEGDFAPYVGASFSQLLPDDNHLRFLWDVYTMVAGVRWLFVHTHQANVYTLADLAVVRFVGRGNEQLARGVTFFDLEASSFTGWAAAVGFGGEFHITEWFGVGSQAAYRYYRAANLYFAGFDTTFNISFRF